MSTLEPPSMPLSPALNGSHEALSPSLDPPPSASGANGTANGNANPVFDLGAMRTYLLTVLPAMFGAHPEELEVPLSGDDFDDRMMRFASENGGPLYVVKVKEGGEGASFLVIFSKIIVECPSNMLHRYRND